MATEPSTRQKLQSVIDDMELISKLISDTRENCLLQNSVEFLPSTRRELIEQLAMPKSQRKPDALDAPDATDLMELLIEKDGELKELLKIAEEQEKVEKVIDGLRSEVNKRDGEIRQLQRVLKEAETVMATAVYQAKQKLGSIRQAQQNKVSSEDLIKYAHRISASNAVSAPPTWGPGDPRRPYPTDLEMRHSSLSMGTFSDTSSSVSTPLVRLYSQEAQPSSHPHPHHQAQQLSGLVHHHHTPHQQHQPGMPPSYSWQPSQESGMSLSSHHSMTDSLKGHVKEEDDVELMSSDSSSSSSSDE